MRKTITLALVAVLAFAVVGPVDAKKKAKKPAMPVELQFFMRADEGCDPPYLSLTAGSADASCYYGVNDMMNEYPPASAIAGGVFTYEATEGVPFKIDASRKIVGTVTTSGWAGLGVGAAKVDVTVTATIAGEEKVLGAFTESYTAMPNQDHVSEFELELDPALAGLTVEALKLDYFSHGNTLFGRGAEHNGLSFIKVPALQ